MQRMAIWLPDTDENLVEYVDVYCLELGVHEMAGSSTKRAVGLLLIKIPNERRRFFHGGLFKDVVMDA